MRYFRYRLMILAGLAVAASTNAAWAQAPEQLAVGEQRIDGTHIQPFEVVWRQHRFTDQGEEQASNRVVENVERVEREGETLLRFTQVWYDSLDAVLFTTVRVADQRTLAYRAFHTGGAPGGFGHLDFNGTHVSGVYVEAPEGPSRYFSLDLDDQVFASLGGLIYSALPLELGLEASFPAFGWGGTTNPKQKQQTYRVLQREKVTLPDSYEVDAVKLAINPNAASNLTFWVSREAPYFVRAESRSASGSLSVFEIEEWSVTP
ncbi:MAG: hypothetical protein ABFS14_10200 [Gemmatimonadota bacterium]